MEIDTVDKWQMLCLEGIHEKLLSRLGFVSVLETIAYDTTANDWIKNEPNKTWILLHDANNMSWTLELDCVENGMAQPIRVKEGLIYIHQIQHCLRNPQLMTTK